MPVPAEGLPQALQGYLAAIEERIAQLETPQGPQRAFRIASASLTAASAVANGGCVVVMSDLKTWAASDGAHWYRTDTGALVI